MDNNKIHFSNPQMFKAANRGALASTRLGMYFAKKYGLSKVEAMNLAAYYIECIPAQIENNTCIQDELSEIVSLIKTQESHQSNEQSKN